MLRNALQWCFAHPEAAITATVAFLLVLWKRLPVEARAAIERRHPRAVNLVRVAYALFPDLVKALAAARAVKTGTPKALDELAGKPLPARDGDVPPVLVHPPPLDRSKGDVLPSVVLLLGLALGGGALHACSATAVQRQAVAADVTARVANRALDVVVDHYERAGREALRAACCDRGAMREALGRHRARWTPVIVAWEGVRLAHDAWAVELEACAARGPDAGSCGPGLGRLAAVVLARLGEARCVLRAVGVPDPIAGPLDCPAATDGGLR